MTITYRTEPRSSDSASIREIIESTGFFYSFEVEVAVELIDERLAKGLATEYHFVFADDDQTGKTIGYSCFGPVPCTVGSFDLYWIAVHDAMRGRGLGAALMERTERLIASGVRDVNGNLVRGRRLYIETSGREKYVPTQRFYEKCGCALAARLESFYDEGDDKLVYVRVLNPAGLKAGS